MREQHHFNASDWLSTNCDVKEHEWEGCVLPQCCCPVGLHLMLEALAALSPFVECLVVARPAPMVELLATVDSCG